MHGLSPKFVKYIDIIQKDRPALVVPSTPSSRSL
jgi:hypothetical protein